ncbi:uncharacterized protein [Prorops nasuta]|uniref:uncharacterized protein n=1 Tax=Prorops nasuta TaxID=863751 RepID=UPI0034CE797B
MKREKSMYKMELQEMCNLINSIGNANEGSVDVISQNEIVTELDVFNRRSFNKESTNRNRYPASRRLLTQAANTGVECNVVNSNYVKDSPCMGITMIHTSTENWPPSRKKEEARTLENLKKRVEQSKQYKINPVNPLISQISMPTLLSATGIEIVDNRPKLLRNILLKKHMTITYDVADLETNWRDSEFITECLCWHNVYRQRHYAPFLTMSPQLCEYAQTWANHLAHTNTFYYRNDRDTGQNLYCRPAGAIPGDVNGQEVASYWYSAVKQYDFMKESDILHTNVNAGHFTQLIWASSQFLGVGKASSRSGKVIVVANYQPIGNISGQFKNNVFPPLPENANAPIASPLENYKKHFDSTPSDTFESNFNLSDTFTKAPITNENID